jgi:hypothetical protein
VTTKKINFNEYNDVYKVWLLEFTDNIILKKITHNLDKGALDEKVWLEFQTVFNLLHSRVILNEKSLGEKSLVDILPRSLAIDGRESTKQLLKNFTNFVMELFTSKLSEKVKSGELTNDGMNEQIKSSDHILQAIAEAVNQDDQKVIAEWKKSK